MTSPTRPRRCLLRPLCGCLIILAAAPLLAQAATDYERDIKPILRKRCYACHGVLKSESDLRLDTAASAIHGGASGPALVPGNPQESLILERVAASDAAVRMPPEGEPLSPEQIARLREWIASGAAAPSDEQPEEDPRDHWAFRPPVRPALPIVSDPAWTQNPIDHFIARQHEQHGLTPRPPVEKSLLLRRVSLNLIGLPPTRDELHAFLADHSEDAYERVVDRLLNSPQYGERWARHWMDVWRYADWFGRRMVPDVWNSAPQIWHWRDWSVQSLNDDKSYARMLQEMLAADEIAPEDPAAAVATGFLIRNWYALNPNDWMRSNVEHTAKAFLGLTFNCAHCHDHKYDPITHDDYFRFRAFFEPIGIRQDRLAGEADPGPFQEYEYSVLRKIVRLGTVSIYDRHPEAPTWFYTGGDERNRDTERGSIQPGLPRIFSPDDLSIDPVELPPVAFYPALRPEIQQTILQEHRDALNARQQELAEARRAANDVLPALREELAAAEATIAEASVVAGPETSSPASPSETNATEQLESARQKVAVEELTLRVAERKLHAAETELASVEARIAADNARYAEPPQPDVEQLARSAAAAERAARVASAEAAVAEQERLLAVAKAKPADDAKRQEEIDAASKKLDAVRKSLAEAESAEVTETYTPLGQVYPDRSTGRRKALAEWIGSPDNPLTARVAVNHIWMRHFHSPLVSTVFDFGRNGAAPTHPELLDWLAVEFMESGWSMKHLHRLIVTSRTYQMATSHGDIAENNSRDPENRYLWRMNVGRMEAEVVRDSLMFCAGKLDPLMGGQELENSEALTTFRRSLYYSCQPETDGKSPLGRLFDAPDPKECYRRTRSIVPQQALALANSDLVHNLSASLADSICQEVGLTERPADEEEQRCTEQFITAAFEQLLSRSPTEAERATCIEFMNQQRELAAVDHPDDARRRAAESLIRVLYNHNDFIAIR